MSVQWVRIGEVLELKRRVATIALDQTIREIGVRSFGRGLFVKDPTTGADIGVKRVFHVEPGDLIVSNIFAWEGAVAVADEAHDGLVGSHRFMTWVGTAEVHLPFLAHYFVSDAGLAQLRAASPGSAGRNRTLSIKNFKATEVPLPPLPVQRRIAAHLDRVAAATKRVRPDRDLFRNLKARLLDTLSGEMTPLETILCARHGELVDLDRRDYRITGVYSFGKGLLDRGRIAGTETKYRTLTELTVGDVVYSKLGAFEGAVGVVDEHFAGSHVTPEFPVFSISSAVDSTFLHHVVTSPMFEEKLRSSSAGVGARQKRVHPSVFLRQTVPLPSLDDQHEVSRALDKLDQVWRLTRRNSELASSLLPAARNEIFNGMQ